VHLAGSASGGVNLPLAPSAAAFNLAA